MPPAGSLAGAYLRRRKEFPKLPDAFLKLPDGFLKLPDAFLKLPDAFLKLPDAFLKLPDAFLKLPDGFLKLPDAFLKLPDEFLKLPDAFLKLPEVFLKLPDAFLKLPDGFLKLPDGFRKLQERRCFPGSAGVPPASVYRRSTAGRRDAASLAVGVDHQAVVERGGAPVRWSGEDRYGGREDEGEAGTVEGHHFLPSWLASCPAGIAGRVVP